ncbi:MAG: response regulator transcription factor [Colwellia sp.]|nr:response regulator transcription factor [Colwellia sp.]
MINILVAEDEEILRVSLINKLVKYWPQTVSITSVSSGSEALKMLNELKPDIAFLDIQMGDISGIDVVKQTHHCCHVVFVTAYDKYAIQAFDAGAIDYLLKPYSDTRLKECIERVNVRLSSVPLNLKQLLLNVNSAGEQFIKRLKIQIGNKIWLIPVEDIICLKASGRYVKVLTKEREALVRMPLKNLCEQLDPDIFWQVHRSTVMNVAHLDYVKNIDHEQIQAYMNNMKDPVAISRSFSHLFRNLSSD